MIFNSLCTAIIYSYTNVLKNPMVHKINTLSEFMITKNNVI